MMDLTNAYRFLPSNTTSHTTAAFALVLALTLFGLHPIPEATAQTSEQTNRVESTAASQWHANFDEQIARTLRRQPEERASYIRILINEAADHPNLDLSETADGLVEIIRNDPSHDRRLMAVQALYSLGPTHVGHKQYAFLMSQLVGLMQDESSPQLRGIARSAVSDFNRRG